MKTKLLIAAILCCAQLWMGCAAKNPEESDIKGTSTAAVSPACDVTAAIDEPRAYRIQPGDQLDVPSVAHAISFARLAKRARRTPW